MRASRPITNANTKDPTNTNVMLMFIFLFILGFRIRLKIPLKIKRSVLVATSIHAATCYLLIDFALLEKSETL